MRSLSSGGVLNRFVWPKKNGELAELMGILLGDGGITRKQVSVTLNSLSDGAYALYVGDLINKLFSYKPSAYCRPGENSVRLSVSGVELVKFLVGLGLKVGNKVKQQVGVPKWIIRNKLFSKLCLRGLVDTDGCIFLRKDSHGIAKYSYANMYFSNSSQPIRIFVYETLKRFGFRARYFSNNQVRLYSEKETMRYLEVIGSSNSRIFRWMKRANFKHA